jgi:hypothetical protein
MVFFKIWPGNLTPTSGLSPRTLTRGTTGTTPVCGSYDRSYGLRDLSTGGSGDITAQYPVVGY